MNHKRYIRAKLREMGNSNLSLNQTKPTNEVKTSTHNPVRENDTHNNTLYNFSYQDTLNVAGSPKHELINHEGFNKEQGQVFYGRTDSSLSSEGKLKSSNMRTSQNEKLSSSKERIVKVRLDNQTDEGYYLNKEDLFYKNYVSENIKVLNERLLEKTKHNKCLERDLKEKTDTIKRLTSRLDKQKQEISALTDKLNHEKSINIRVEMNNITKKLERKELEIEEINQNFEEIINDYKKSLENCILIQHNTQNKLKELEKYNISVIAQNEELVKKNGQLEKEIKNHLEIIDEIKQQALRNESKFQNLNNCLKSFLSMIMTFSNQHKHFKDIEKRLITNFSIIFEKNDKNV